MELTKMTASKLKKMIQERRHKGEVLKVLIHYDDFKNIFVQISNPIVPSIQDVYELDWNKKGNHETKVIELQHML